MGAALEATGRDIVYSCSWPAYIGDNETQKPFATFINDGEWGGTRGARARGRGAAPAAGCPSCQWAAPTAAGAGEARAGCFLPWY